MRTGMKLAKLRVSPDWLDQAVAELVLCVAGVLVMACGFYKIGRMTFSDAELFVAVLLVTAVGLLLILAGMAMHLRRLILEMHRS